MTARWMMGTIGVATTLLLAACGGQAASAPVQGASPAASAAVSSPAAPGAGTPPDFEPFRACMAERGVELPEMGQGSGTAPGSGQGAGPGRGITPPEGVDQATFDAAMAACEGQLPQRGGLGLGAGSTAAAAYRSCLVDHGVEVGDQPGDLQALDRDDPAVQEAMAVCEPLLPAPFPSS